MPEEPRGSQDAFAGRVLRLARRSRAPHGPPAARRPRSRFPTYPGPGPYTLTSAESLQGSTVEVRVDRTFTAPPDQRALGMVLIGVGFTPSKP